MKRRDYVAARKYQFWEFCKATGCPSFSETTIKIGCYACKAHQFHQYLNKKGYLIEKDFSPYVWKKQ
jgi:hypothetical protein